MRVHVSLQSNKDNLLLETKFQKQYIAANSLQLQDLLVKRKVQRDQDDA